MRRVVRSAVRTWRTWAQLSEGAYALRSNVSDWSDEDLWCAYIQLTEAETAFRIQKSDLSLRPVWHHVVLLTRDGQEIRQRCVTQPTDHQKILLHHLGLPRYLQSIQM